MQVTFAHTSSVYVAQPLWPCHTVLPKRQENSHNLWLPLYSVWYIG